MAQADTPISEGDVLEGELGKEHAILRDAFGIGLGRCGPARVPVGLAGGLGRDLAGTEPGLGRDWAGGLGRWTWPVNLASELCRWTWQARPSKNSSELDGRGRGALPPFL